jgi:hypothetical protein
LGKGPQSKAYPDIVFELNASRGIELDFLQGLTDDIVGLALARLGGLDGGSLVNVSLVVDIELAEGVGEGEEIVLLELRKFPGFGLELVTGRWTDG